MKRRGRRAEQVSVSISRDVVQTVDRFVDEGEWKTRSDFFEKAAREALRKRQMQPIDLGR